MGSVEYATDYVSVDADEGAGPPRLHPRGELIQARISAGPVEQPRVIDQDHVAAHGMREERGQLRHDGCHCIVIRARVRRIMPGDTDQRRQAARIGVISVG